VEIFPTFGIMSNMHNVINKVSWLPGRGWRVAGFFDLM